MWYTIVVQQALFYNIHNLQAMLAHNSACQQSQPGGTQHGGVHAQRIRAPLSAQLADGLELWMTSTFHELEERHLTRAQHGAALTHASQCHRAV